MKSSMLNKYNSVLHFATLLRFYKVKVEILRTYGGNQKSIGPPARLNVKLFISLQYIGLDVCSLSYKFFGR